MSKKNEGGQRSLPVHIGPTILETRRPALTVDQADRVVAFASQLFGDLAEIAKGVVEINRIRTEAQADVERIRAVTNQVIASTRAEIDRLVQIESHTRTRGQVVVRVIEAITKGLEAIPEVDSESRHQLIDSLRWLVEAALKD